MTIEAFGNLTPQEQEAFINEGGTISSSPDICCDLTGQEVKQVGSPSADSFVIPVSTSAPSVSLGSDADATQPALLSSTTEGRVACNIDPPNAQTNDPSLIDTTQWSEGFDIKDPVELLFLLDDDIASSKISLHKWQAEFMFDFASDSHTKNNPFRAVVRACNGSGKDKYVVSACVVWLCMRYSLARGVVTNGSGVQLDNQTEAYIRYLCQRANAKWAGGKELIWKCNYRYYECLPTRSPIVLFATDEPNKAEGYHPLKAGGKMAIFASEAKAIPDTIFTALTRCTGFTHRVDVSTPGPPVGYFYDQSTTAVSRKSVRTTVDLPQGTVLEYHITAFDCPHITPNEIKQIADSLPGGENNPVYKSAVLAEFSTTDEMVVIPYTFIWKAVKHMPKGGWLQEAYNKAGLDLSDGGAETVLLVRNGNKHIKTIPFRFDNTEDTLDFLEEKFKEYELTSREALIFADCCGIGKPMLNALRRRGWSNIRYVDSRAKAAEPRVYFNRGTELFFNVRKLLERHELIVQEDKLLLKQLSTRYYKLTGKNVHQLLTKLEQRSRGYPSPDRADAFNLAFWDYKSTLLRSDFSLVAPDKPVELREPEKEVPQFSLRQWAGDQKTSLAAFERNVAKRQPITHLQRELERYNRK